jgi:hypothetical protein
MDLHLKRDDEHGEPNRLVFPRAALDQARLRARIPNPQPPAGDLAARIELELDRAQQKLDQIREDVDTLYRFPDPHNDDEPPSTAA